MQSGGNHNGWGGNREYKVRKAERNVQTPLYPLPPPYPPLTLLSSHFINIQLKLILIFLPRFKSVVGLLLVFLYKKRKAKPTKMEPTVESPTTRTSHFDNLAYGNVSEQPPEKHAWENVYSCEEEPSPPVCGKDIPDEPGKVNEYIGMMSHCNPAYDISEQPPEKNALDNVYSQLEEEPSPPVCAW